MNSFEDVRQVLGQHLNDLQSRFVQSLPLTSMQGRRIQNVGDPQAPNDAVNLSFLTGYVLPQIQTSRSGGASNVLLRSVTPAAFAIGVSGGDAKPDLAKSPVQNVVLAANTNLVVPANRPSSGTMIWILVVDNPTVSPLQLTQDATYSSNASLGVAAGTRTVVTLATTQSGNTVISSVLYNQEIALI